MSRHGLEKHGRADRTKRTASWWGPALTLGALLLCLAALAETAIADDPGGLASNDFGNNGEDTVPASAYEPGRKERESKEYKKENPDAAQRDYHAKGGAGSNHDSRCRARLAYKAARYQGPTNGYNDAPTRYDGHSDGPRPKAGGGNYSETMSTDPAVIINNIYKFVEDICYPKRDPGSETSDADLCTAIDGGTVDIGTPFADPLMCKTQTHLFTSLVRELGFPVREKNILPSIREGVYDTQTAAANVWYGGAWHFFDVFESFTDSKTYLERKGHAGYGPYHDADVWTRTAAPKWDIPSDYRAGRNGELADTTHWKKLRTHKKSGGRIETETFALRLGLEDPLGNQTGFVHDSAAVEIERSNYFPFDRVIHEEHLEPPLPNGPLAGDELLLLLFNDDEPPGPRQYALFVSNPTAQPQPFEVSLAAMPESREVAMNPEFVQGVLPPNAVQQFPVQVFLGGVIEIPPDPVTDLHVVSEDHCDVTIAWSAVPSASEYLLYLSPTMFEHPDDPGVIPIGVTTGTEFTAAIPDTVILGVEVLGQNGLRSGLDPEGGSTTVAWCDMTSGMPWPGSQPSGGLAMLGASPNPATTSTSLQFRLAAPGDAAIQIYRPSGQLVRELLVRGLPPGVSRVEWDLRDADGELVPAGIYLYRLKAGERIASGTKVLVIR